MIQPEPRPKKKQSRLAMALIAGLTAVSLIGLLSIGLVLLTRTRSLTLAQARTRAAQWLPASAVFLRADEDEQETELNYHDPASGRDYELEIDRRDGELIEMHIEQPNGQGAAITRLSIAEASAQVRQYFAQADPGSVQLIQEADSNLLRYRIAFQLAKMNGTLEINPETGELLSLVTKTADRIIIPINETNLASLPTPASQPTATSPVDSQAGASQTNPGTAGGPDSYDETGPPAQTPPGRSESGSVVYLSLSEARQLALARVPGGVVDDFELKHRGKQFIYEFEINKDGIEYEIKLDALTKVILSFEQDTPDERRESGVDD